uniref:Uncharacterized protein n=1 Tax=Branchiostoma floridae TaxID=7739 RepID=C3ZUF8_BRAFL|eukprot:XP_002587786.1 hypothetical protein BRAFLDRAFT_126576 [Branchiostoma floridae]
MDGTQRQEGSDTDVLRRRLPHEEPRRTNPHAPPRTTEAEQAPSTRCDDIKFAGPELELLYWLGRPFLRPYLRVFLTTRLRNVPGYHDADAAMGKSTYKIDASRSKKEQELRAILRRKYQARPATTSMMQFDRRRALKDTLDPHAAQATEAWLKLANDKDKRAVLGVINDMANRRQIEKQAETAFKPEVVPSLHRWLKKAGRSEAEAMTRLMKTLSTRPTSLPTEGPHFHITDYSKVAEVYGANPRPYRRDFVLHPEWKWEYIHKHGDIKRTVPHLAHIEAQTTPYNRGPQIFTAH